ncbi:MAG: HAMP domain-containing sensor histidine kinase [Actinomycetota bacterium]
MTDIEAIPGQVEGASDGTGDGPGDSSYVRAVLNILEDVGDEQQRQRDGRRALLNMLEDLDTEKSRLESTQRALINMLDDLESERRIVDRTNLELREVNEAMRSFIATAAHDLRSPLASMVGFSTLLTKNWTTLSDEKRLQFATTIDRQSHKLTGLVNDLLTLSSIEGGVLNTQPDRVVLSDAIDQCLLAGGEDTPGVEVSCSPDLVLWADPVHLGRIIDNLLQNAFRYGEPPVQVEAVRLGHMAEIRVIDHGPGVPPEFETKLFGKFARADIPSTRQQKGTGLGLSIVRGLAEANGGQAHHQRNVPQGTCFVVTLPIDRGVSRHRS